MKRYTNIIVPAFLVFSVVSCFPESPMDALHPENYFKDAAALQSWISYCYNEFDGQEAMLADADDFVSAEPSEVLAGTRDASVQTWDWSVLRQANALIDNEKYCKDAEAAARFDAEARFFRALFYFNIVRKFGDVPYYRNTVGASDSPKAANSRDYVMMQAMEEMYDAADCLTGEVYDIPVRINRWTALGFIARSALYEGSFLKYSGEDGWEEYMEEAVRACELIMSSGNFEVYSAPAWKASNAYRNLFVMETMSPKEALMIRMYNTSDCPSCLDYIYRDCGLGATSRFVNHYQMVNGSGIAARPGYGTEDISEACQGRDPRLSQTLWTPGCKELDSGGPMEYDGCSVTGWQPVKFRKSADARSMNACFPILRYSEILLIYAEAKAELGTLRQSDMDLSVNMIRARVGMPAISVAEANARPDELLASYYPNVDKGRNMGVILEIRRERTVELALEGQRIWDMLRWHEGAQIGNRNSPITGVYEKGSGNVIAHGDRVLPEKLWDEDRDYLWPVPASEFSVPGCRLRQNYGY